MSERELTGRTALVTGAGRGLGRAMALGLVRAGASVAIVDIDEDVTVQATDEARSLGGQRSVFGIVADLADERQAEHAVQEVQANLGPVDILINNAGRGPEAVRPDFLRNPIKIWEIPSDAWHRVFGVNTHAPFYLLRRLVPAMIEAGWGRVINVTTSLDTMMRGGYSPYSGSKAANEAHVAVLAQDLAGTGVTANVLVPGGPANTRLIPPDTPVRREDLIQPEQMVTPLLWLTSRAADAVTGRRIVAALWDTRLSPTEAARRAGEPAAWPGLGLKAERSSGWSDSG